MKRTKLTLLLLCALSGVTQAQDSIVSSKFMLGSNLANLIQQENRPTIALSYNITTNNFMRLQVGFGKTSGNLETDLDATNSQNNSLAGDTLITNSPYSNGTFAVQLGYYRTTKIDTKFSLYYGLDFIFRQDNDFHELNLKTKREFSQQQIQFFDVREKITTVTNSYGVAPMFGLQYQLAKRIQIGYEMHVSVLAFDFNQDINRTTVQTSSFDPRIFETTQKGSKSWDEVKNTFNPLSGFFISVTL
ncbi:MAG: hypothetical protein ACI9JN_000499 [Bacteroidia bacterium]|jgi:hypothetical protein